MSQQRDKARPLKINKCQVTQTFSILYTPIFTIIFLKFIKF